MNRFRSFQKISEYFRTLPKISEDFQNIFKNHRSLFGAHIIKRTLHGFQKIWILSSSGKNISRVERIIWKPCNILYLFLKINSTVFAKTTSNRDIQIKTNREARTVVATRNQRMALRFKMNKYFP